MHHHFFIHELTAILSKEQADANQVRFYKSEQPLSDGGGGLAVYLDGKEIEHQGQLPGGMNSIGQAIRQALAS